MTVITPAPYGHNYVWLASRSHHVRFSVRTCEEARIALSDQFGITSVRTYEVSLLHIAQV